MILAIYLILFKGYSVIKFNDEKIRWDNIKKYGACSKPMGYSYGHDGEWGEGDTAIKAVINAYKKNRSIKKIKKCTKVNTKI